MESNRKKTYVADINREVFDRKNQFTYSYKTDKGLSPEIVLDISRQKNEPQWMTEFRLKSLEIYHSLDVPPWGPDLTGLDIENIVTYVRPNTQLNYTWDDVPQEIKDTFVALGIPQAEHKLLAGVGAQYDSEVVYHSIQDQMVQRGVIWIWRYG